MQWSPQQDDALRRVAAWINDRSAPQVFRLFGFAGTGKTTLAKHIAAGVKGPVVFGAFTGKAALVLRGKGCADAKTIHSLIYRLDEENYGDPTFILNRDSEVAGADLVIIDECSMVGEELGRDLLSFGTKVLVLGDPAQLPPVNGEGFFTNQRPDFMLTEIHRQARDNPIIAMSQVVREGGRLDVGDYGSSRVIRRSDVQTDEVLAADTILVGKNATRRAYNRRVRKLLGREFALVPEPGDKLVCLKNKRTKGLLNGGIWAARDVKTSSGGKRNLRDALVFRMEIVPQDPGEDQRVVKALVARAFFEGAERDMPWKERKRYDEFDFGYALTVHKAQGSQWPNVTVFDESAIFQEDRARHLYTAITRASERVTVVDLGGA